MACVQAERVQAARVTRRLPRGGYRMGHGAWRMVRGAPSVPTRLTSGFPAAFLVSSFEPSRKVVLYARAAGIVEAAAMRPKRALVSLAIVHLHASRV